MAILTVLIGIPATLVAIGANPIPNGLPHARPAHHRPDHARDDGTLTLRVLTVAAWLAWAFLAATITPEVLARLRGITAPPTPPGLALPQSAARGRPSAPPSSSSSPPPPSLFRSMVAAPAAAAAPAWADTVAQTAQPTTSANQTTTRQVTTTPPARSVDPTGTHTVTRGESLWSIAATELGDGHAGASSPTSTRHARTQLAIHPGTVLTLPLLRNGRHAATSRTGRGTPSRPGSTASQIAHDRLGDADRYPDIAAASRHVRQPTQAAPARPRLDLPGVVPDHPRHHRHRHHQEPPRLSGRRRQRPPTCTCGRSPRHTWRPGASRRPRPVVVRGPHG